MEYKSHKKQYDDPNFKEFHPGYERRVPQPENHENPETALRNDKHELEKWEHDMEHVQKFEHMTNEHEQHKKEDIEAAENSNNPAKKMINYSKAALETVVEGVESVPREFFAQKAANERPNITELQEDTQQQI